jgi:putative hydrolase of the HAD superfamily
VAHDLTAGMRAVVFDFFGTLTPVSPAQVWAGNAASLAAVMGVPVPDLVAVLEATFPDRITGAFGGVAQTLQELADRLGVALTDSQLARASQVRRERQEAMFALRPESLGVIGALRDRGLPIGLVSDCTIELPEAWPALPLAPLVDVPVFSCLEGTRKPDPRLFRQVAAGLQTEPGECLYVGDGGGGELPGAAAVGMRAVLLAGPDWDNHPMPALGPGGSKWAGARISSLTELVEGGAQGS